MAHYFPLVADLNGKTIWIMRDRQQSLQEKLVIFSKAFIIQLLPIIIAKVKNNQNKHCISPK
jgi:hypothetical protein